MASESIWVRPAPGQRQPSLTREQITETAIELIDAEGVKALSMRRIAESIGVGTMTLYHYVRSKDELLELIDDAVMGELIVSNEELPADDWRAALTMIAARWREVFQRHPWRLSAIGGIARVGPLGPNAVHYYEQLLAATMTTGLEPEDCLDIVVLLDNFLLGHALRTSGKPDGNEYDPNEARALWQTRMASGQYPHLASVFGSDGIGEPPMDHVNTLSIERRSKRSLERLLDGIEFEIERRGLS